MYLGDILWLSQKGPITSLDFEVQIPQANTVETIIGLVLEIGAGATQKSEIRCLENVEDRQKNYYVDAAKYLGIVRERKQGLLLSPIGQRFCEATPENQARILIRQMFGMYSIRVFCQELIHSQTASIEESIKLGLPRLMQLVEVDEKLGPEKRPYSLETIQRRAQSAQRWIDWIFQQADK